MDKSHLDFEIRFYEGIIQKRPRYVEALLPLAEAYTRKGLFQKGLEIDKRLSMICKSDPVIFYNLACSYALVGKKPEALRALRKSIQLGYKDFTHMRKDKDLALLVGSPEFEKLLKSSKKPS